MGLETATYISDLVTTNPPTSDLETQGANHLQLIKTVLQNVFGTVSRRFVNLPNCSAQSVLTFNVGVANANLTFLYSTAGGAVTFNLPTLLATDAGWEISLIKTTTDVNPIFIVPPSGTIQSGEYTGLAKVRRCVPGRRTRILWTGSTFICDRVESRPIGTVFDLMFPTLPVGYEWANGQTLSSAANYPEFFAINGGLGTTPDGRNRAAFGLDNPGGTGLSARITVAGGNFDGSFILNSGGLQNHVLTLAEAPTGQFTFNDASHTHSYTGPLGGAIASVQGGPNPIGNAPAGGTTGSSFTGASLTDHAGGGFHAQMPPALILAKVLVVE
jgi:hypothetical protein